MSVSSKLRTLKAGHILRSGHLIAHQTSTLPGIAASALSPIGIKKAQRFKQRKGPFLLLADSVHTALSQAVFLTPALRTLAKQSWPGGVTLVFSARRNLAKACYQNGRVAIRVDADVQTRHLAQACGGLMLSSSLNRRGKDVLQPSLRLRYRLHRHLSGVLAPQHEPSGQASKIYKVVGTKVTQLR